MAEEDQEVRPRPLKKGFFAWIGPTWKATEDEVVLVSGVDAAMYLRIFKYGRSLLRPLSICFAPQSSSPLLLMLLSWHALPGHGLACAALARLLIAFAGVKALTDTAGAGSHVVLHPYLPLGAHRGPASECCGGPLPWLLLAYCLQSSVPASPTALHCRTLHAPCTVDILVTSCRAGSPSQHRIQCLYRYHLQHPRQSRAALQPVLAAL